MSQPKTKKPTRISELSYRADPAVRDLLDHIANELAAEYVRLVRGDEVEKPSPADRPLKLRRRSK